jgi:hypothetical protein
MLTASDLHVYGVSVLFRPSKIPYWHAERGTARDRGSYNGQESSRKDPTYDSSAGCYDDGSQGNAILTHQMLDSQP